MIRILSFGFIKKYKRIDILIESLNYIDINFELTIAGKILYKNKNYWTNKIKISNKNKILFIDKYFEKCEISNFYKNNDVMIISHESLTGSGPLMLSKKYCMPVIINNVPGINNLVHHGLSGFIYNYNCSNSLATNINLLNKELIIKMKKYISSESEYTFSDYCKILINSL